MEIEVGDAVVLRTLAFWRVVLSQWLFPDARVR
jgi:hypothetical protein